MFCSNIKGIKGLFREKWGWMEDLGAASPCQKGSWVRPSVQGMSAPGQPGGVGLLSLWWEAGGGSRYWVPPELWLCALESSRYTGRQCWSCCEKKNNTSIHIWQISSFMVKDWIQFWDHIWKWPMDDWKRTGPQLHVVKLKPPWTELSELCKHSR